MEGILIFSYPLIAGSLYKSQGGVVERGRKGKAVIQRSGATDIRRITSRWRVSTERRSYFKFRIDSNKERILSSTSEMVVNFSALNDWWFNCNGFLFEFGFSNFLFILLQSDCKWLGCFIKQML